MVFWFKMNIKSRENLRLDWLIGSSFGLLLSFLPIEKFSKAQLLVMFHYTWIFSFLLFLFFLIVYFFSYNSFGSGAKNSRFSENFNFALVNRVSAFGFIASLFFILLGMFIIDAPKILFLSCITAWISYFTYLLAFIIVVLLNKIFKV